MIGGAKGIGLGIDLGLVNQYNRTGSQSYIEPEVLDSLVGVWSAYGMTNDSPNRSTIKNKLSNKGGDFVISNAAFKLNSGFGKYEEDFTDWRVYPNIKVTDSVVTTDGNFKSSWFIYKHSSESKINGMNIKVSGIPKGGKILYFYISDETANLPISYTIPKDGIYHLPESKINNNRASVGFTVENSYDWNNIRIEQIPSFEGAFVTDGIDDLIKSTKSATEMLDGSNEVTVVSMIHQIKTNDETTRNNWFFTPVSYLENRVVKDKIGKTGIYGYTSTNVTNAQISDITPILGDKNDYTLYSKIEDGDRDYFTVEGFQNQGIWYVSSIAWYWTIIANKVLTTDQINQVIAYFNLDRTLKPDILCNTIKQGITNENHAEFGDKLIDYSGNGRDIQLNNIAWDGDSGIGKYNYPNWKVNVTRGNKYGRIVYYDSINGTYSADFKGVTELYKSYGLSVEIRVNRANTIDFHSIKEDGIYTVATPDDTTSIDIRFGGENVYNASCDITITQIPSHAGALCLDGVNDFGKVTGMPIYKDYTFIIDRKFLNETFANQVCLVSKSKVASEIENGGAFIVDNISVNSIINPYSFYKTTSLPGLNTFDRQIVFQSKYKYLDKDIAAGTSTDSDTLWLGTFRDNDSRFANVAIYSLMSFPYSMSEFLIERQLKKHKLGTLYPDMVEFRPVITINGESGDISYANDKWENINIGDYINIGEIVHILLYRKDIEEISNVKVNGAKFQSIDFDSIYNHWNINIELTSKSLQKINITIDEYIRYENIVQPYPVLLRFKDENGNEVSWGGKFRVGSTITIIGSAADSNLLPNIYNIFGLLLNGNQVTSSKAIVEKTMVFKAKSAYIFDNNEPNCILSPRLLSIPNSSYKILGYIPDISGNGNHGVIHNSAYAERSGVNEDGSYQFDGVDDFVTIPTVTGGGKQVLMKVNWDKTIADAILYDQRGYPNEFAIYNADVDNYNNPVFAYQARNNGQTYIDGILNKNIKASELRAITHNITITNELSTGTNTSSPVIGSNRVHDAYFTNMALYDFMLFDNVSTDDKIKQLNEYVGIEAKVELPPYYWDAYGKTNLDGDKATIQQRGVAVGDFDLTNNNLAYEGMSGYNGYPVVFGANKTWANESNGYVTSITSNTIHITNVLNAGLALLYSYVKYNGNLQNIKEIPPFKIEIKGLEGGAKFIYKYLATSDATKETNLYLGNGTHELPKSFLPTEALINNAVVGFSISPIEEGVTNFLSDITIEVLPEYENGLVYDGITDYSKNANIPALDDFTAIIKREWLKKQGCPLIKGSKVYEGGNGNALLLEWDKAYNFVFYKRTDIMEGELPDNISFITPTNYNGNVITRGSEQDTNGICIAGDGNAGFANMVFYKLILYPKTIPLLQINFLKNLMERDEIIDLNNKIFIQE